ncbi:hypothetical protein PCANC_24671 [Puccinia coronata f. sp. avenae]|uniref:Uncharacterized protein n=1 Tax=Puccinia coronata f. sp. avenae TaxID=200324 RepID=A0A2N5TYZ3_9BASI|nr:hypothetical protein PCANC_24671 [Puccinia coronata f. sp. avenae]
MTEIPLFFICLTDIPGVKLALTESLCEIYKAGIGDSGGLIAAHPKGACKPPYALPRMPHAVRTPTNGVRTAGLACGPARQAFTAGTPVRPGSRKPLESRGLREPLGALIRVPNGTLIRVPLGTLIRVPNGTLIRVPLGTLIRVPLGTLIRVPFGTLIRVPIGTLIRVPNGTLYRLVPL